MARENLDLTGTTCHMVENVRLALELIIGLRVRFAVVHLSLKAKTGRGEIIVNDVSRNFTFTEDQYDMWSIEVNNEWYTARLDTRERMRVILSNHYSDRPGEARWTVGTSYIDRHYEPLFPQKNTTEKQASPS